jgi:UDP-N-acetylglucosamine diphosphorylase / glucose-1-phosphate thymidylyltransferase / UDP-N-acetylgalactosamine diphosphorylase / glucosamine-1-phosphate N-acetyltransferase / galactosamine-1-phosphate N-acetyltransferase
LVILLFDTSLSRKQLYPLSLTRPVCDIRFGIFTLREWYTNYTSLQVAALTADVLMEPIPEGEGWICISASVIPSKSLMEQISQLKQGEALEDNNGLIAYATHTKPVFNHLPLFFENTIHSAPIQRINHPMDFVTGSARKITEDIALLNKSNFHSPAPESNKVFGEHQVHLGKGAKVQGCILNTEDGPIFIDKDALVMEGSCIRGPVCIGQGAVVKMGTQLYQGTSIGKFSTVGGEIKNSIVEDYSNKAHYGYLGDSMIGQWCNIGAGTTNSNVKNNGGIVKMWHEETRDYAAIGKKAGMVMGDFSKTAVNTSINTGTTIGVCCSIHQSGFPDKFIPSFSWGPGEKYLFNNALRDVEQWCSFKNKTLDGKTKATLEAIYHAQKPS